MAYRMGSNTKLVIGIGQQIEAADREVTGINTIDYVEKMPTGEFYVELADGSTWRVPAKANATFKKDTLYAALEDKT